jgi:hypothetical protein
VNGQHLTQDISHLLLVVYFKLRKKQTPHIKTLAVIIIMGQFYGLAAEFGKDKESCERFIDFFNNKTIRTNKGEYPLTNHFQSYESNFWSWTVPQNLPSGYIHSQEDPLTLKLIGDELVRHIKSVPFFRYCIVGIDVDVYLTEKELFENPHFIDKIDGFVIREALYNELGRPGIFTEFIPGFVWKEYQGKKF